MRHAGWCGSGSREPLVRNGRPPGAGVFGVVLILGGRNSMNSTFSRACVSIATLVSVLAITFVVSAQGSGEWKPLLNGKDLSGWTVAAGRGGANANPNAPPPQPAQWKVENGVLVGGQGTGRGSLVSSEQYKDFELEFEFMLAELGTKCSAELIGEKQENASEDKS